MRHLIVGAGVAGVTAALHLRFLDPQAQIDVLQNDDEIAYSRPGLFDVVSGHRSPSDLRTFDADWATKVRVKVHKGFTAWHLDPASRTVRAGPGGKAAFPPDPDPEARGVLSLSYDRLLIATGAAPLSLRTPANSPGASAVGAYPLRTLADALGIRAALKKAGRAVVLGGGPLSCKLAETLTGMGLTVTALIESDRILSRALYPEASRRVQALLEGMGIEVRTSCPPPRPVTENGDVVGVRIGEEFLPAGFVFGAKGVKPAVNWLRETGIALDANGGIGVDETQRTSIEDVFAAGDVASAPDVVRGHRSVHANWLNAVWQARVAATAMVLGRARGPGYSNWNVINLAGCPVAAMGLVEPSPADDVLEQEGRYVLRRLIVRDSRLVGAQLVGDISGCGALRTLMALGLRRPGSAFGQFLKGQTWDYPHSTAWGRGATAWGRN